MNEAAGVHCGYYGAPRFAKAFVGAGEASANWPLAAKHRLPAIYLSRQFTTNGGLISYGPDLADLFFRAGSHIDKILKGTKPSDLPVEQPTKFELVINMKTAKALGLEVPSCLLARADEVIE